MDKIIFDKDYGERVYISKEAYERIVIYGSRYANPEIPVKAWREVYGVLVGYLDQDHNVHVKTAVPIVAGDSAGVSYENREYADTAFIDENVYEKTIREDGKDFFVGWWHTHPGFGFFYSDTDKTTQLGYQQANPYAIGIIFDCTLRKGIDSGIEVLHLTTDSFHSYLSIMSPYDFVPFEIEGGLDTISEISEKLPDILKELDDFSYELKKFDKEQKRKNFAQLQRNFGLLLVKKTNSEIEEEGELGDDEKDLYIWNEDYIKKSFRIPKFREKIEKMLRNFVKIKDEKKKLVNYNKIKKILQKPGEKLAYLRDQFEKIQQKAEKYYKYLDTKERTFIENFESNLIEYITIYNSLVEKLEVMKEN